MAYTPTTWRTGDVITSQKLNKLQKGLFIVTATAIPTSSDTEPPQASATSTQVLAAFDDGKIPVLTIKTNTESSVFLFTGYGTDQRNTSYNWVRFWNNYGFIYLTYDGKLYQVEPGGQAAV